MIRKMFRVIGGFVAFLTYHTLILPLVIMLLPFFSCIPPLSAGK